MQVNSAFINLGLGAEVLPSKPLSNSPQNLGVPPTRIGLPQVKVAYVCRALIGNGTFSIDTTTGSIAGSSAWSPGVAQVESATVQSSAGLTGFVMATIDSTNWLEPVIVTVSTASGATASQIANSLRLVLGANEQVSELFTVSGTGANVVLTKKTYKLQGLDVFPRNDPALNIAIGNGEPSAGIIEGGISTKTMQGSGPSGTTTVNFEGTDFEGLPLPNNFIPIAILLEIGDADITLSDGDGISGRVLPANAKVLEYYPLGLDSSQLFEFGLSSSGIGQITLTVLAE